MTYIATLSIPAGTTVLAAISIGLLPLDAQVTNFPGLPNPTVGQLMASGQINGNALASSLSFSSPVNYGGN